jgi:MFS transporter, DHA2 family, multidrug resistance protein
MNIQYFSRTTRHLMALGAVTGVEFLENGLVMFGASRIVGGLPLSHEDFAFAYTLYGVAAIFMLYKHQWFTERLGYQRFVRWSLLAFAVGAVLCATADSTQHFIAGRVLQGLGGATFFTAGRMAINDLPEVLRVRGLAVFVGSLLGSSAIAPLLAAGLIGIGGWPAIFWFGLLESLLVGWLATRYLSSAKVKPDERSHEHWGWLGWLAVGIFGLQYAIQGVATVDWESGSEMLIVMVISIAMLTTFAWRQWGRENPLINYRGLFQVRYLLGLGLYFGGYFMAGASGFMVPLFLQEALNLSLSDTAWMASLGMFGSVLAALLHMALTRRWPWHRSYMFAGLVIYAGSNWLLSRTVSTTPLCLLLASLWLCGAALPFYLGPVAMGTFSSLHAKVFSHGYQVKNIVRQLGLSSSIAGAMLALHFFGGQTYGGSTLIASHSIFLLMALATIPIGIVVLSQRVFR